jgi:hypothetical protein
LLSVRPAISRDGSYAPWAGASGPPPYRPGKAAAGSGPSARPAGPAPAESRRRRYESAVAAGAGCGAGCDSADAGVKPGRSAPPCCSSWRSEASRRPADGGGERGKVGGGGRCQWSRWNTQEV